MRSLTNGNIKTALASVQAAKWRSFLTMMGVIIGIVSVVTIVSIGEGVKHQVVSQINHLGKDLVTVRPGQMVGRDQAGKITSVNIFSGQASGGALSDDDVKVAGSAKGVDKAVPLSLVGGPITRGDRTFQNIPVIGTSPDLPAVLRQPVEYGGFFTAGDDTQNGAIIGTKVADTVFGQSVPLGQSFTFHDESFIVRGIFKEFAHAPLSLDADFNNAVFIPDAVANALTNNNADIYEILVQPKAGGSAGAVAGTVQHDLKAAHGNQEDFTVLKQDETLGVASKVLNLLTALIGGIAAISLLVGGIGIMNVMLVSVTERMHEIGIRKAIGATSRQIMMQFMIEAALLSVCGGLIGVALSIIIAVSLRIFTDMQPIISWPTVAVAVGVSLVVGVVFGTLPALKAARKDPIEALRHE